MSKMAEILKQLLCLTTFLKPNPTKVQCQLGARKVLYMFFSFSILAKWVSGSTELGTEQ